jgi:ribosomal-protein-alanine N-acetyltransferase
MNPVYPGLKSARLALDPLTVEHLDSAHALWCEPGVRRYLWDDRLIDRDRATEPLRGSELDFRERRFGLWGLYFPTKGILVGFCGLRRGDLFPEPELLYGLSESYWHQGLATEAAQAVLAYGFDELTVPAIGAATDLLNVSSARVLDRLGMRLVRRGTHNGLDTMFYRLTRAEWQVDRSNQAVIL